MATHTQAASLPLSAHGLRNAHSNLPKNPRNTWTTSSVANSINNEPASSTETSGKRKQHVSIPVDRTKSPLSKQTPATSPIELNIRPRRLSGHLFGPDTISPSESSPCKLSLQGQIATAIKISQYKPQAINVKSSCIEIEPSKVRRYRSQHTQQLNSALDHTGLQQHQDSQAQQRPDSASSWISQSTFSDDDLFPAIGSTTSLATTASTHEIVKGFTPGGPPSMYRSQSNLSRLSGLAADAGRTSSPVRTHSRGSTTTTSDVETEDECPIDEDYDDEDSYFASDERSNCGGLTMLFGSKRVTRSSNICTPLYTLSSRKTRSQMLAAELTKPIQESLLQDRQHKRQVNLASLRRTQSDLLYSDCYFNAGIFQYW